MFGREFTSSTGLNNGSTTDGNAFASFLLGLPSGDFQASGGDNPTRMGLTTPLDLYTNYFGGYVQDDWRVSPKFTLNYGLRIEHEDGMREVNNNFTVGFDRTSTNPVNITIPGTIDPTGGTAARQVRGGLKFAGVNGNPTQQGDPPAAKFSPRLGAVYSLNTKTVLRAGYGMYWAPWNYPAPSPALLRGHWLLEQHAVAAVNGDADRGLRQPVPERARRAVGQQAGPAGGRRHEHQLRR